MIRDITVFNFTNVYVQRDFRLWPASPNFIDCSDISGKDSICDDIAADEIRRRMKEGEVPAEGIHLIDNGNYHYMSAILTEGVKCPFIMIYFDHHPDLKPSVFGDILSCGSWVRNLHMTNPYVKAIAAIGVSRMLYEELDEADRARVYLAEDYEYDKAQSGASEYYIRRIENFILENDLKDYPVYLSIDKDVLEKKAINTNWDQGSMDEDTFFELLKYISENFEVAGVDICGEPSEESSEDFIEDKRKSLVINSRIAALFLRSRI
jgi:arginase family enzyme